MNLTVLADIVPSRGAGIGTWPREARKS